MSILVSLLLAGLVIALIARSKKRSFVGWYIYGVLLLPIAFIHVLFAKRKPPAAPVQLRAPDGAIVARSALGEMWFNGREVTITRRARVTNLFNHGLDGEKSIAISAIQAVQFKQAKGGVRGYLQLTISGGVESQGGLVAAARDENTLLFDKEDQPSFERLAAAIKAAVYERSAPGAQGAVSVADELAKFAKLRDEGLVNDEEFAAKKKQLLGS